jgi:hypothetical protein
MDFKVGMKFKYKVNVPVDGRSIYFGIITEVKEKVQIHWTSPAPSNQDPAWYTDIKYTHAELLTFIKNKDFFINPIDYLKARHGL